MAISKQDRNIGITIALVLIVCVVSLIAIGSILIRLITPGVERVANLLGAGVRASGIVNYNFPIPARTAVVVEPTPNTSTSATSQTITSQPVIVNPLDIKLPQPRDLTPEQHAAIGQRYDLEKVVVQQNTQKADLMQIEGHIYVPKLGLYSPILNTSNGESAINYGFWLHPNSDLINQGEWGVLCERSLFQPFAQTSCLFLNELTAGDDIFVIISNTAYKYKVVQQLVANNTIRDLNSYSPLGDTLRIITSNVARTQTQILIAEPAGRFNVV